MDNKRNANPFAQMVDPFTSRPVSSPVKKIEDETKSMITAVFSSPDGMRLLDRWDDLYLRQPTCPVGSPEGFGYARSAVNEFIVGLRRIVNEHAQSSEPRYVDDKKPEA